MISKLKIKSTFCLLLLATIISAGNPDRQGESGANQLLLNPWGRSAGLHGLNSACIKGVEAMRLNVAGLSRLLNGEIIVANSRHFVGTDIMQNALGLGFRLGENGALGVTLTTLSFGDIPITTVNAPEGTGGTFSPNLSNLAIGYSYMYENKISVGILGRVISENLPDISAFGFSIDAGVQYITGEKENFKLGISLLNIGSPMKFGGQGLAFQGPNIDRTVGGNDYNLTFYHRAEGFNLPTALNLGVSYDWHLPNKYSTYLRFIGNFTSNAYFRDEIGGGLEFSFRNLLILRGGYRHVIADPNSVFGKDVYTGASAGFSVNLPKKKGEDSGFGVDYSYRATNPFRGSHNVSVRYAF
jgi:hypothetical protein